jgi:acetyl esterase/lipase
MVLAERADGKQAPRDVRVEDVEYLNVGGKPLLARFYIPAGKPIAGVVEAHGGQWMLGDRLNNAALDQALAAAGVFVMAVDFRMPPDVQYPASIADIHFAVRWLKAHAARYGIAPERVGGVATSSGAHQLLLATMKPSDPRYAAHPSPPGVNADASVRYLVVCWSVSDPLARYRMAQARNIERFLKSHAAYFPDEAAMAEGNPQLVLERGENILMPPLLYIQGTADDNLTPDMADRFVAAYRARGGDATLHKFDGQPHMFITKDPQSAASQAALARITDFIRERA